MKRVFCGGPVHQHFPPAFCRLLVFNWSVNDSPFLAAQWQDNADKLDIPGADRKKMVEYRAQLDKERESALAKGRNRPKRKVGGGLGAV